MAKIVCEWAKDNKVYVDENGNVYPCCYWHHEIKTRKDESQQEFIKNYGKDVSLGKYNLKNKTLHDILTSDFYENKIKLHIEGNNPNKICKRQCEE